jgi:hypothetical protein
MDDGGSWVQAAAYLREVKVYIGFSPRRPASSAIPSIRAIGSNLHLENTQRLLFAYELHLTRTKLVRTK